MSRKNCPKKVRRKTHYNRRGWIKALEKLRQKYSIYKLKFSLFFRLFEV